MMTLCEIYEKMEPILFDNRDDIALQYALNGDIENLEKMKASGHNFSVHCGYAACANGDLKTLEWLANNGCHLNYCNYRFAIVCKSQYFDIVKIKQSKSKFTLCCNYLLIHLDKTRMDECFLKDNSHILDWLLKQGVSIGNLSTFLMYCLCKNNYHALRWAFKNRSLQSKDCKEALKTASIYAKLECKEELAYFLDELESIYDD